MEFVQLVHRPSRRSDRPSAPWVPAALSFGPAAAMLGFGFAGGLEGRALAVAPITILVFGVFLAVRRASERGKRRAVADEWIALGHDGLAARYGWRLEELRSPRERKLLAGSLRSVVREVGARPTYVRSLINRRALFPHRGLLVALANRLADLERPVSASGVVAVQRLLTLPHSPLYARPEPDGPSRDTGAELGAILDRLEVRR